MKLAKNDFIEIEFTGKTKDNEVFDSNIKDVAKTINPNIDAKPFVFCLGQGMFLKGVDDFLIGKEPGKEYKIELKPEDAFGKREPKLIQLVPMKIFVEQKVNPVAGAMFNFDGRIAKILSVSGGRVMVDFNNPLSGKEVVYDIKVLKKLEDLNEKIKSLNEFLFKQDLKFEVQEKNLLMQVEKQMKPFIEMFKDKFKEIFDLDLVVEELVKKTEIKEAKSIGKKKESMEKESKKD